MLIEMMTGLVVGLLVTITALATLAFLQVNASVQGDSMRLQQRGDAALLAIGAQLRQAGAIELQAADQGDAVRFSTAYSVPAIGGEDGTTDTLRTSYEYAPGARDCLGNEPDPNETGTSVNSRFSVVAGQLRCLGSHLQSGSQVLADQVEDFQVRYGTRTHTALGLQFRDEDATTIGTRWADVSVVHVCLQLAGELRRPNAPGAEQRNCQGQALRPDGRLHRVVQVSFHLRNAAQL